MISVGSDFYLILSNCLKNWIQRFFSFLRFNYGNEYGLSLEIGGQALVKGQGFNIDV